MVLVYIDALLFAGTMFYIFCLRRGSKPVIKPLFIGVALSIAVMGVFLRNYNFFFLCMLLLPLVSGAKRRTLGCLYLGTILLFPEFMTNYVLAGLYLGSVSAITCFNLGSLIVLLAVQGRDGRDLAGFDLCAWGIFFLFLMSQSRGYDPMVVLRLTHLWFFYFMVPYLVVTRTIRSREDAEQGMLVFTWAAVLCGVVAMFEAVRGWPLYQELNFALHVPLAGQGLSATMSIRSGFLRAQGPVSNPTGLGIVMAMGLQFAPGLKRHFRQPHLWAIYGILLVGLIVSQSRGAWVGTIAGLMIRLFVQRRYGLLGSLIPVGLVGYFGSKILADDGKLGQLLGKSGQGQFTADYRSNLLYRGIEEMGRHPLGQSPQQLQISMNDMRQGEGIIDFVNSHLYIGLSTGIAGLLLWLALWTYPLIKGLQVRTSRRGRQERVPIEIPVSVMVTCFVALLFTSPVDRNAAQIAISLALIAVLVRVVKRAGAAKARRERQERSAEPAGQLLTA